MVDPDVIPGQFQTYHADLDPLVWNMRPSPDSPHLNQRFGGWNFGPQGSVEVIDADLDGDGMYDLWELDVGLDPTVDDAGGNADGDGYSNLAEFQRHTVPTLADTDGDGRTDRLDAEPLNPAVQ